MKQIVLITLFMVTNNVFSQLKCEANYAGLRYYYYERCNYDKQVVAKDYNIHEYEYFVVEDNLKTTLENILSLSLNKRTYNKLNGYYVLIDWETDLQKNVLNMGLYVPHHINITQEEFDKLYSELKRAKLIKKIVPPPAEHTGDRYLWGEFIDCGYANDKKMPETTPPYYQRPYDTQYIAMPSGFETVDFTLYPMLSNAQKAQVKGAQVFMKFPHINGIQVIAVFVGSFITRTEYLVTIKDGEIIDKLLVGRRYKTDNGAFPIAQFDYLSKDGNIVVHQLNTTEKLVQTNFQEMNATMLKTYYKIDSQTGHFIQNDSTSFTTKKITCKQLLNAMICNLFLH